MANLLIDNSLGNYFESIKEQSFHVEIFLRHDKTLAQLPNTSSERDLLQASSDVCGSLQRTEISWQICDRRVSSRDA